MPILVGPVEKIAEVARQSGIDLDGTRVVDAPHSHAAAAGAVALVRQGEAELLMKGSLHTDELLGAVVSRETGLRTGRRLSHVFIMDVPTYHKVLIVTDAAINIAPTLEEKADICQNAIDLAHSLGVERPKVAILAAVETVTSKMPATIDAAALCKMAERGQIRAECSTGRWRSTTPSARRRRGSKGIASDVAGDPDILLAPDLEAGNMLAKQLTFLANADSAGLVLGARVPIILTSRADSVRARIASCAVAMLAAHARRRPWPSPLVGTQSQSEREVENYVLVLNAGSSSLKFCVYQRRDAQLWQLEARGQVDGIGSSPRFTADCRTGQHPQRRAVGRIDPRHARRRSSTSPCGFARATPAAQVLGVGHRVVHGGLALLATRRC